MFYLGSAHPSLVLFANTNKKSEINKFLVDNIDLFDTSILKFFMQNLLLKKQMSHLGEIRCVFSLF